jgi:hypothetical protein
MCLVCLFSLFDLISATLNSLPLCVIVALILEQQLVLELGSHIYKFA